jgi:tripartite-type tricarboxylate transporter receptor subunit TctC
LFPLVIASGLFKLLPPGSLGKKRQLMRFLIRALFVGIIAAGVCEASRAQEQFPSRAITLVVPVPPGGAADFIARLVGQKLSDGLGQPVVISNRGGASGTIAAEFVAKSLPDGYTLLLNSITTHGIGPHLYTSLPYDPVADFAPIALVARLPLVFTINAGHAETSVSAVIAYAKANPGKLTFASSGSGGAPHLAGELFKMVNGIDMVHVAYRGSGPAVIDVAGGRVDIMIDAVPSLKSMIEAGKLRPLATASDKRSPILPNVPTFKELGINGIEVSLWFGMLAPAKTPTAVVAQLNGELKKILSMPDVQESFAKQGADPSWDTPAEFTAFMRAESERWGDVVTKNNIKME